MAKIIQQPGFFSNASIHVRWGKVLCCLIVVISTTCFYLTVQAIRNNGFADIDIFLETAGSYTKDGTLYKRGPDLPAAYSPMSPTYKFPPFYQWTLKAVNEPEDRPGSIARVATLSISLYLISGALCLVLLRQHLPPGSITHYRATALITFFCFFNGFFASYSCLAPEIPINTLLCLVALFAQQRPGLAGSCIGVAAALKLYPAYVNMFFFARRNYRALLCFVATLAITVAIGISSFGKNESLFYAQEIMPILMKETSLENGANLNLRWFMVSSGINNQVATSIYYLLLLSLTAITFKQVYRQRVQPWSLNSFCLIPCLMLLSMENYWRQYLLLLCLPTSLMIVQSTTHFQRLLCWLTVAILCCRIEWATELVIYSLSESPALADEVLPNLATMDPLHTYFYINKMAGLLAAIQSLSPLTPVMLWLYHYLRCR